jgi:signal-transduction protein with cAMP-binding, CBS, and nucleotidyltransferase domain
LRLLAEGELLNPEFLASLHSPDRRARDIMASPIVSVSEDAEVGEIARLLITYHMKRVPVVRDGQVVGFVSRVDLLRAIAGNILKSTHSKAAARGRAWQSLVLAALLRVCTRPGILATQPFDFPI